MICRKGQELLYRYSWGTNRNDKALLNYFFLHERRPPLLCAVDLPARYKTLLEDIEENPDDSDHAPGGSLCTQVWDISDLPHNGNICSALLSGFWQ